jgi:hypothetical protein
VQRRAQRVALLIQSFQGCAPSAFPLRDIRRAVRLRSLDPDRADGGRGWLVRQRGDDAHEVRWRRSRRRVERLTMCPQDAFQLHPTQRRVAPVGHQQRDQCKAFSQIEAGNQALPLGRRGSAITLADRVAGPAAIWYRARNHLSFWKWYGCMNHFRYFIADQGMGIVPLIAIDEAKNEMTV